jgi:hypothetical protein
MDKSVFGDSFIDYTLYEWICNNIDRSEVILEIGSGQASTGELGKLYKMYSVEHDIRFIGCYNSEYIYAPIWNGWYDLRILEKYLPSKDIYTTIIIDGPQSFIGRRGFVTNLHLFNENALMIFDDLHRPDDLWCYEATCRALQRQGEIIKYEGSKPFGAIPRII